jgi:DNA-binding NarL/FixJ family response regulator
MKVLLVDDHPLILSALRSVIQSVDARIVVLGVEDPEAAFTALAEDPTVDLVLLDLNLGAGIDGFAVLAELRQRWPALPVVVVSGTERLSDMVRVIDLGAMGFVPKRSSSRELYEALALVIGGGVYIPPALLGLVRQSGVNLAAAAAEADADAARRAASRLADASARPLRAQAVMQPMVDAPVAPTSHGVLDGSAAQQQMLGVAALGLTPRQGMVLSLLLKGLPNKLIARELNVSVDTVKDHVAAVLRGLGVNSRTQAVLAVSRLTQHGAAGTPPVRPER